MDQPVHLEKKKILAILKGFVKSSLFNRPNSLILNLLHSFSEPSFW